MKPTGKQEKRPTEWN